MMAPPDEDAWDAWTPEQLAQALDGLSAPWYIVGGWALDLWLGTSHRAHEDLEFATLPEAAPRCAAHLAHPSHDIQSGLRFFKATPGGLTPWSPNQPIDARDWQFWGADLRCGVWRVDMMMERGTPERWVYKRNPAISQPRELAIRWSDGGIPYLAPAHVLLFKAKACRTKDEDDFDRAVPTLPAEDRADLRAWLTMCHPGHPWLSRLGG